MSDMKSPIRVLVVDDYAELAELFGELLTESCERPIEVELAHDGAEAVAAMFARPAEVVVLDINMPVMDGIEAALAIRARLGARAPLLIGVTGNMANISPRSKEAFDRVLPKPVDMALLARLVCPPQTFGLPTGRGR